MKNHSWPPGELATSLRASQSPRLIQSLAQPAVLSDADKKRYATLVGGITIAPSVIVKYGPPNTYCGGTLGLMVKYAGQPAMLTNHHVLYGPPELKLGVQTGTDVSQPLPPPDWPGPPFPNSNTCAQVITGVDGKVWFDHKLYFIDAAIAGLGQDEKGVFLRHYEYRKIGNHLIEDTLGEPAVDRWVWKVGRSSGYTIGVISYIAIEVFWIESLDSKKPFADEGDSGSVIVDLMSNQVVGLLYSTAAKGKMGFACHAKPVFNALEITL